MNADRTYDVLDRLFSQVLKPKAKLVAYLIMHDAGNQDAAGIGKPLQTRRHIDAVPENVVAIENDVADIDADAEFDALFRRDVTIAFMHTSLNVDRAAHGIDHADELHQHSISGGLHDSSAMFGDLGVDQFLAMRFQLPQRAFFVDAH